MATVGRIRRIPGRTIALTYAPTVFPPLGVAERHYIDWVRLVYEIAHWHTVN